MASSRRTGTNESIDTYGAGQDYTALATWESATDNDNVSGTVSPVLECLAAEYDDAIALAGATNNSTYFRILRPMTGNFHSGRRDTGVRFYSTADAECINWRENFSQVQDIVARITNNSTTSRNTFNLGQTGGVGNDQKAIGCIATASSNAGTGTNTGFRLGDAGTGRICVNCLAENCEAVHFSALTNASTCWVYNCTAYGATGGNLIQSANTATMVATNCISIQLGIGASFGGAGTLTQSFNASDDGTAAGTGSRTSATPVFVQAGAGEHDYHLAPDDDDAEGFGTDLSADGTFAFDDDIDRHTRSGSWDIGCDENRGATKNTDPFHLGLHLGISRTVRGATRAAA